MFIARGPTGRAFIYSRAVALLASLTTGAGVFLDDVWVGRDGAASAKLVRGHLVAVDSQLGFAAPWSAKHRATAARRP